MKRRIFTALFFSSWLLLNLFSVPVLADENSFGVVSTVNINDDEAKNGSIVILSGKDVFLSSSPYQNIILGVIAEKPEPTIKGSSDFANGSGKSYSVVTSGVVMTNVTTKNGEIKKGDFITSSSTKGIGMKANGSGIVLGTAMDDFNSSNPDEVKQIPVAINVHYHSFGDNIITQFTDVFKLAVLAAYEEPRMAIKYISSTVIVLATIVFSFISVGKVARLGIIALGRNPMASNKINKGIVINLFSAIAIIAAGITASFFIVRI